MNATVASTRIQACEQCGSPFRVRPCEVRKAEKRGTNPPRFCSAACQHLSYRGSGNPKWRGGRVPQVSGYVYAYAPDHPFATQDGYVMEHRLVMEASIGRFLTPDEQVHHRNHVRDDNRIENLELMADITEHRILHAYYQPTQCAHCGTEVVRSVGHRRRWARAFCSRKCAAAAASERAREVNTARTHCKNNHEFTPENTSWTRGGTRRCRTCDVATEAARPKRSKRKGAAK